MLKFATRSKARAFTAKAGHKVIDLGKDVKGSRWVVKVLGF